MPKGMQLSFRRICTCSALTVGTIAVVVPALGGKLLESPEQHFKKVGQATLAYLEDHDEGFPLAYSYDSGAGTWRTNKFVSVPAGWRASTSAQQNAEEAAAWANSIRPYLSDSIYLSGPDLPTYLQPKWASDYANPLLTPVAVGVNYNGLLHTLTHSEVNDPKNVPLFWTGNGPYNRLGAAISSPALQCRTPTVECRYDGDQYGSTGPSSTIYQPIDNVAAAYDGEYGYFVYANASVKKVKLGVLVNGTNTDFNKDPFNYYDEEGKVSAFWWTGKHPWLFRPDYQP